MSSSDMAQDLNAPTDADRAHSKMRSLALDIGITALTAGGLVAVAFALSRFADGMLKHMGSLLLDGLAMFFGPVLGLALLERITTPTGPRKPMHVWLLHLRINISFYVFAMLAGVLTTTLAAALARHFHLGLIDLTPAVGKGALILVGAVLLSMLIGDFFYYGWHRLSHRSTVLWQSHKLHHMDPHFDVLTNMRDSWGDALSSVFIQNLPLVIMFKLDAVQAVTTGGILGIILGSYPYFFHTNIPLQFGKAGVLVVGPQWHRIHHSRLPEHRDKNFASMFPLWDILFGTNIQPAHGEFPPTGVDGETEIQSLHEAIIFTPREWLRMYRARRTR